MRKRVSEIIAASLLCACLALAGTAALAVAGLLGDGPTAQAQESGGDQQANADGDGGGEGEPERRPGYEERRAARIARYQAARAALAGASGQASSGLVSGLASSITAGGSDSFTVSADALDTDANYRYSFSIRSSASGLGFNTACTLLTEVVSVPAGNPSHSTMLTIYGCKPGDYTLITKLWERSIGEDEEYDVETDTRQVSVTGTPTPTTPAPVDKKPTFGSTSVSNQSWTRNSRISTLTLPTASNGDAPLTYSLSPSLPSGVTRSGRSVTGTPTATKSRTQYTWTVTDNDGDKARLTFYVTVALEPPTITISRNQSRIDEGQDAEFTLRASHAPLSSISVKISVTESGAFIRGTKPTSQRISAGSSSKSFSIQTSNDDVYESNGSIVARVRSGAGYTVGSPSSASITVRSEDPRPTPEPVDNAPTFGSSSISNKIWKQNTRIPSFTLPRATGGDGTLTYSLSRGQPAGVRALPAGVSRSGRSVSGTPSGTMARTKYTWTATDSDRTDPDSATLTFYITVNADLAPAFGTTTTISDKTWTHNKAITNFTLPRATGGDGTLTYSLSRSGQSSGASALPAGVSRSAHSVSGTPSALLANTTFTWTATDSDGDKASLTFKIKVLPQVSIARKKAEVAEGQRAEFTLTASAAPLANLAVTVRVTQSGTFISGTAPTSATISAGQTTATLSVPTTKDSVDEADGSVRAEVRTGTGYAVGSSASASVSVRDTPRISIAAGTSPVTEGANATFTITAAGAPLSSISIPVSVTQSGAFIKGTAPTRVTIAANGTSATLTVATENDAVDEQNGSITATLPGNAASPYVVVSGSSSASVTVNDNDVKLATPTGLTVTPLPERKARLSWGAVPNASAGYQVEITSGGSSKVFYARKPSHEIALDSILNGKGFAHADAYQFKVRAVYDLGGPPMNFADDDTSDPYVDGDYSNAVELRDTPIISINGDSSGRTDGNGQAVVTWNAVPGATAYTLRWRKLSKYRGPIQPGTGGISRLGARHSNERWRPQAAAAESDWNYPTGASSSGMTTGGLDLDEIYAFQLNYTTANGQGFSVREAYVWPSNGFPSDRVATYPFFGHWPSKAYSYTICRNTFPTGTQDRWVSLINAAFGAWSTSTSGVVTAVSTTSDHCEEAPMKIVGSLFNDHNEVIMVDTTDIGYEDFTAFVEGFITEGRIRRFLRGAGALLTNRDQIRYTLPYCIFDQGTDKANACVVSPSYVKVLGPQASTDLTRASGSVDVLIDETPRTLNIPSDTGFNSCDGDYRAYRLVLHEAGHAFGISGFSLARLEDERSIYVMAHPTIADSVMNYDEQTHVEEPDCSPHPFDILAIQALYQTVD